MALETTTPPARQFALMLHGGLSRLSRRLRNVELPSGITPERMSALAVIEGHGWISVTELARLERVRPTTMSRMISALEHEGLLQRRNNKEDRRGVLISTTAKGRKLYERAVRQSINHLASALEQLTPEQRELTGKLAVVLETLADAFDSRPRR